MPIYSLLDSRITYTTNHGSIATSKTSGFSVGGHDVSVGSDPDLSPRKIRSLTLAGLGLNTIELSDTLMCSPHTVKTQLRSSYEILEAANICHAMRRLFEREVYVPVWPAEQLDLPQLSALQIKVLRAASFGMTRFQAARELGLDPETIKSSLNDAAHRLDITTAGTAAAVMVGFCTGVLTPAMPQANVAENPR